ncbi:MAG: hypothetical protein ACFCD0_29995 [Gemmataceae bacterium]
MSLWYRIFAQSSESIDPNTLLEHLHTTGYPIQANFLKDDLGWFEATFSLEGSEVSLQLFHSDEKGVRAELDAFAAWIESQHTELNQIELMERVVTAKQVFAFEIPDEQANIEKVRQFCYHVSEFLVGQTQGLMQVDGEGLFDADGQLLLRE